MGEEGTKEGDERQTASMRGLWWRTSVGRVEVEFGEDWSNVSKVKDVPGPVKE